MKIKNTVKRNRKLIQLQILKLHYKKKSYNFKTSTKETGVSLNKISNVIYNYHIHGKRILFLGFPNNFKRILRDTKHIIISQYAWENGMLSNRSSSSSTNSLFVKKQTKTRTYSSQLALKLQKKLDLAVIYNLNEKTTAVEESFSAKVPVISFSKDLKILDNKSTYESPEGFTLINNKVWNNNFFFSVMETTLKKALKSKRITTYQDKEILSYFTNIISKTKWPHSPTIKKTRSFSDNKKGPKYKTRRQKKCYGNHHAKKK